MTEKSGYYSGSPSSGTYREQQTSTAEEAPLISSKWVPLNVSSIESIHIVNKRYFQEDERITTPTGTLNLYGKLKEADLKITFTLPFTVNRNQLSAFFCRCTGLLSEDICVKIGTTIEMNAPEPRLQEPQKFSVLVPLLRGYLHSKPIVDRLVAWGDHEFVHFTLSLPGIIWPSMKFTTWRIRIKVNQMEDRIECVSVSDSAVDMERVKETSTYMTNLLGKVPGKLENWFPFSTKHQTPQQTYGYQQKEPQMQYQRPLPTETTPIVTGSSMYVSTQSQPM